MAARKLQTEMERTFKRIHEGVDIFEEIHVKLMAANTAAQKEKYETDLKSQIKKLQRLRDQLKTWLANNDIKDKTQLMEYRRLIETQMERFKALEREMKTKAFSKEGLQAATRLDPASQLKHDARHAIEEFVDALSRQIELTEAELEMLAAASGGGKKKSKAGGGGDGKAAEFERLNERRSWHVGKLEAVMRMLDNGRVTIDQVNDLKEDVQYFVDTNGEEDFEEDEGIYDDLHLEEEEEAFAVAQMAKEPSEDLDDILSVSEENGRTPQKERSHSKSHQEDSVASTSQPPSPMAAKKTPARKNTMESKYPEKQTPAGPTRTVSGSVSTPASLPRQPLTGAASLPPIKYAAAAAAAVAQSSPAPPSSAPVSTPSQPAPPTEVVQSPPAVHDAPAAAPTQPAAQPTVQPSPTPAREQPQQLAESRSPQPHAQQAAALSPRAQQLPTVHELNQQSEAANASAADDSRSPQPPAQSMGAAFAESSAQAQRAASRGASDGQPGMSAQHTPNALADLMNQFESVKQKSVNRLNDLDGLHTALENGLATAPEPRDSERPRYYHPRNPYPTPSYYPQHPHPILDDKNLYARMDLDTLFFIFYYRTNTYEQWCAARELKRQSWRFHKQYLTWFQRLSQPLAITEEYEQGMYIYFDWENTWCQRRKTDFRFEYRWLSED